MDSPEGVDLCGINAELLLSNPDHYRKRLINLELRNVINLQASLLQSQRDGKGGRLREVDRLNTSVGIR